MSDESGSGIPTVVDNMQAVKKARLDVEFENLGAPPSNISHSDGPDKGIGLMVAAHYNNIEEKGLAERKESRIFYMRNFNNWVKSTLIKEYVSKLNSGDQCKGLKVLDLCCGKGGDLIKWQKGNIKHLICADIAATSMEQCQSRYSDMKRRMGPNLFSCEFLTADCTKERLRSRFRDVTVALDLVSCQFSFHYCFESLPQAEMMLKNASECLKTGGYFIGSIPDAADIVQRVRDSGSKVIQNDVFKVELCCEEPFPLFGAKYNFFLEGVVDCPEFLVHFPTLERLAASFGLKLVFRERFCDFYERMKTEGGFLLKRMQALECYPPPADSDLVGALRDYLHAEDYIAKNKYSGKLGTLSQSEWDAVSLYQVFAFQKIATDWSADGKPEFRDLHVK